MFSVFSILRIGICCSKSQESKNLSFAVPVSVTSLLSTWRHYNGNRSRKSQTEYLVASCMPVPCKALISYNVANIISRNIAPRVRKETYRKYRGKYWKISARINLDLKNSENIRQIGNLKNSGEIRDICNTGFLNSHVEYQSSKDHGNSYESKYVVLDT